MDPITPLITVLFILSLLTEKITGTFDIRDWGDCLLSSFFLAFGSKFFHDLLDLIFQVKNLKRKLNKPETYTFDKVTQLDSMLALTPSDYAQMAFDKYEKQLLQIPNVSWIAIGKDSNPEKDRYIIKIYLKDNNTGNIPKVLHIKLPNDIDYPVKTEIETDCGEITVHYDPIKLGTMIGDNQDSEDGTLGCFLKDDKGNIYLITCFHVVQGGEGDLFDINNGDRTQTYIVDRSQSYLGIGDLEYGEINETIDIALIKFYEERLLDSTIACDSGTKNIIGYRSLEESKDIDLEVFFRGYVSGCSKGKVTNININPTGIKYRDRYIDMQGMIALQDGDFSISKKGDSGSVLIDNNGNAIGMIFAGDDKFSYAIPMDRIMNKLNKRKPFDFI